MSAGLDPREEPSAGAGVDAREEPSAGAGVDPREEPSGGARLDLQRFTLLAELEEAERSAVAAALEEIVLPPGAVVFEEGEQGEGLIFVAEGGVRVVSSLTAETVDLGPGAAVGTLSLVASGRREARAETTSRSRLLVLRRSSFRRFADAQPRAACRLLEAIVREAARLGREALETAAPR